jgi:hypothetical protein
MDVGVGVAKFGVAGREVAVGFTLPQATRPARTIRDPERMRINRRKDMLPLPRMRFINTIIQQVREQKRLAGWKIGMLYFCKG